MKTTTIKIGYQQFVVVDDSALPKLAKLLAQTLGPVLKYDYSAKGYRPSDDNSIEMFSIYYNCEVLPTEEQEKQIKANLLRDEKALAERLEEVRAMLNSTTEESK